METIIRENEPVDLGDDVIKCKSYDGFLKFNIKSSSCHIASSNIFIPPKIRFLIFKVRQLIAKLNSRVWRIWTSGLSSKCLKMVGMTMGHEAHHRIGTA